MQVSTELLTPTLTLKFVPPAPARGPLTSSRSGNLLPQTPCSWRRQIKKSYRERKGKKEKKKQQKISKKEKDIQKAEKRDAT